MTVPTQDLRDLHVLRKQPPGGDRRAAFGHGCGLLAGMGAPRCGILPGMSGDGESDSEGQPTRCWLRSRSYPPVAGSGLARTWAVVSPADGKPILAVDLGKDAIWVMDANTNALVASAWLGQASATPAKRKYNTWPLATLTVPVLVVCVPGLQRLSIGCLEIPTRGFLPRRGSFRFSWLGAVQLEENDPAYWVTAADWLTLVEKFGLAPRLEDRDTKRVKGYPWGSSAESPNT